MGGKGTLEGRFEEYSPDRSCPKGDIGEGLPGYNK
jgi:hypothetical protein